ncbi:MAG: hypothetical protein R8G34_13685 [Paracoccaceae bacterium]|nr:hypothetical protein [Paracoccaceae bacterium]
MIHDYSKIWYLHRDLSRRSMRFVLAASMFVLSPAIKADACAFDMLKPERTVIDWIVDADALVLARPMPGNSFAFAPIQILIGPETTPEIQQLVDSGVRRRLAANPDDAVLFARLTGGQWRRVAYVDDSFGSILGTALSNRDTWRTGMPASRVQFVDALQHSPNPRHKAIVISELDKVPYEQLRDFDLRVPVDELVADLWSRGGYPYQATRALLLGIGQSDKARTVIASVVSRATESGSPDNFGAFAAAFIELEGALGVTTLADRFLDDPHRSLADIEQVVMAMSVHHALADVSVKDEIDMVLARLVRSRPAAGAVVARQFSLREDWSQVGILQPLVRDRKLTTIQDMTVVAVYLARAATVNTSAQANGG